ncbi:nucleotidyltransferase domain-containing protein [Rhizobium sp. Leaf383]|uniref:nucleotidyltransferase family protein n=1 Tax=Rhizobium sp. Leaf383 TaxID=1736357 RepID=UPI000714289E|nr:nucleotidyltransferase domain-containing protein [Rhizobium sp. Leaf383]KQS86921.1 hypothetical protein ASG58_01340 [Rhizobium sp. Leaf383]
MNITDKQLADIRAWAAQNPLITSVQLFGSRVRGTARADSDLDVAIGAGFGEDALQTWIIHKGTWEAELRALTGLVVNVDLYHPTLAAHVRGYVEECGFEVYRQSVTGEKGA